MINFNSKIYVAGHNGLVGSAIVRELKKKGYKKIITTTTNDIYIALDTDARDRALSIAEKFLNEGKRVFIADLPDKDPSEMGFTTFTKFIQQAKELDLSSLMLHKLNL